MSLTVPDVSTYQGVIDWPNLTRAYPAVIVRAHNGWKADDRWSVNGPAADKYARWWGAYQYLPASVDPVKAAHAMRATVGNLKPDVMILDLEEGAGNQGPRQRAWLAAMDWPREWTYSGLWFSRSHGLSNVQWLAAYSQTEPSQAHTLWQFSSGTRFPGIVGKVDASLFHGTLADLQRLTGGPTPPPGDGGPTGPFPLQAAAVFGYDPNNRASIHDGSESKADQSAVYAIRREVGNTARGPYDPTLAGQVRAWQVHAHATGSTAVRATGQVDKATWEAMARR